MTHFNNVIEINRELYMRQVNRIRKESAEIQSMIDSNQLDDPSTRMEILIGRNYMIASIADAFGWSIEEVCGLAVDLVELGNADGDHVESLFDQHDRIINLRNRAGYGS